MQSDLRLVGWPIDGVGGARVGRSQAVVIVLKDSKVERRWISKPTHDSGVNEYSVVVLLQSWYRIALPRSSKPRLIQPRQAFRLAVRETATQTLLRTEGLEYPFYAVFQGRDERRTSSNFAYLGFVLVTQHDACPCSECGCTEVFTHTKRYGVPAADAVEGGLQRCECPLRYQLSIETK